MKNIFRFLIAIGIFLLAIPLLLLALLILAPALLAGAILIYILIILAVIIFATGAVLAFFWYLARQEKKPRKTKHSRSYSIKQGKTK